MYTNEQDKLNCTVKVIKALVKAGIPRDKIDTVARQIVGHEDRALAYKAMGKHTKEGIERGAILAIFDLLRVMVNKYGDAVEDTICEALDEFDELTEIRRRPKLKIEITIEKEVIA